MDTEAKRAQKASAIEKDPRWASVVARNPQADGTFYYSVTTTGVYCRPSCAARLARPEHVQFHATCADAEKAGFRPCKRCQPNQAALAEQHAAIVAKACHLIAESEEAPDLAALANHAGMSRYHFHRVFKTITGLTPHNYVIANRMQKVRKKLGSSDTVTEAMYEAGYNSSGRFYETIHEILGMAPSHFRAGGAQIDIRFAIGECSLGSILIARSDRGVCAILLGDDPEVLIRDLQDTFPRANLIGLDEHFEQLVSQVVSFIEDPAIGLHLPLDIQGTAFQQRVWQALRQIPAGETASYTEIARRIGAPNAVRAVAQACSANKLAVAIPCHRVVKNDGSLSGYRWGVERKRALLQKEERYV
ncbi:bifunctional DNA-binding transcriptional regulator/O6-methylguanine-DNA methyltransferase Ada [Dictyobacter formicarum]|nr:bifunctional DNA-binding transcriptional regulator/O6-methylguanine-DNA methyltransferase Ada [Dictyobacter formicarum]